MSRKDYELIARTFKAELETADAMHEKIGAAALRTFAETLATALRVHNPRFNRDRFLAACGV